MQQLPAEELQIYDIYDMWHVPFWQRLWFKALLFGLASVVFVVLLYLLYRVIRQRSVRQKTILDRCIERMQQLKARGFHAQESELYYVLFTVIIKDMLYACYKQDVYSYTDQQLVDYIKTVPLSDAQKEHLARLLLAGQWSKFAQKEAISTQLKEDWQQLYDLVLQCKQHVETKES